MRLPNTIASLKIGGKYFPLRVGETRIGDLKIDVALENKAKDLYSWVVYIENDSEENSPRITELFGLDIVISVCGEARLNTLRGDDCTVYSFFPESFELSEGSIVTRIPSGGRSSCTSAFPYFDMEDSEGKGLALGIGWSGAWRMDAQRTGDEVRLTAGFQDCDFYLMPHEKVRSVRALIYFGEGGENKIRGRFVSLHREFYSPIPSYDEKTYFPMSANCFDRYFWGNVPKEGELLYFETEEAQNKIIENTATSGMNAYWLDACWFEGVFRTGVGNYRYAKGFPQGLKKLGDKAHENGMKFILWFEPVRAFTDTDVYNKFHWDETKIIPDNEHKRFLVNLGDPEVLKYQLENISGVLTENGVDIYRQDFNIAPREYLKKIEPEGRSGIAQIKFVEGMYRLWDAIRERFPKMLIDNCASGGRLIDVETNMRSIPFWRSDMMCRPSPLAGQNEILGLSRYIPYHFGSSFDYTPYFMRSSMTQGISCNFGYLSDDVDDEIVRTSISTVLQRGDFEPTEVKHMGIDDYDEVERMIQDALKLREYWRGDFTPLTPSSPNKKAVAAYSLDLIDEKRGVALVFRREEAEDTFLLKLTNVDNEKIYALKLSDEDLREEERVVSGEILKNGYPVSFKKAPSSLAIYYKEI